VFVTLFATGTSVSARNGPYEYEDGSGDDENEFSSADDSNDDGSADYYDVVTPPMRPPHGRVSTRLPDDAIIVERTSINRGTTSVYTNRVEIGAADEGQSDEDVKSEALTALMTHPAVLAAIIVGGVLTILFIVLLVMFVVYRMRKKDEGSYSLDDPKTMIVGIDHHQQQQTSSVVYIKAPTNDREFYA